MQLQNSVGMWSSCSLAGGHTALSLVDNFIFVFVFVLLFVGICTCICWIVYLYLLECGADAVQPAAIQPSHWSTILIFVFVFVFAYVFVGICICICWNAYLYLLECGQLQLGQRPLGPLIGRRNTSARPIRIKDALKQIHFSV